MIDGAGIFDAQGPRKGRAMGETKRAVDGNSTFKTNTQDLTP